MLKVYKMGNQFANKTSVYSILISYLFSNMIVKVKSQRTKSIPVKPLQISLKNSIYFKRSY